MRVAYYSPMPPSRSGIADYSTLLLPELAKRVEVEVARPGRFRRAPRGDVALYHVGNDPEAHGWIVEALRKRPGVVVLHEIVLHHLVSGMTLGRGDGKSYLAAMEHEAGVVGRLLAWGVLEGRVPPIWETRPEDFPLAGEVLELATGLIVHSRYVEERARALGFAGPVWRVPHPAWSAPQIAPAGDAGGEPLIGCFGHINASKRVLQLLDAFRLLRERRPGARLLVVGSVAQRYDLAGRLARYADLGDALAVEDYVPEERLWALMAACDIHISLRAPTMGETSGSALRALSLGKPLVVSDVGWFSELPGNVALRVAPDEHEVVELAAALELLAARPEARAAMGAAGLELARREHAVESVAERYCAALEEAAGGAAVADAVVGDVARAAAEAGIGPGSAQAAELGRRLREAGLE